MNRFVIGGILAALVVVLTGSLTRLLGEPKQPGDIAAEDLGSLPVEQAGMLVRRQSDSVTSIPDESFPNPTQTPGPNPTQTPEPFISDPNVIPLPGATPTYPPNTGDVAPIQPSLVQPGVDPQRPIDPDLDSIPALW